MKSSRMFWGVFFLVLGALILLNNFFYIALPWGDIWRFWPVVLILIGVSALTKGKDYRWIITTSIAAIAGLVLFASVQNGCTHVRNVFEKNGEVYSNTLEVANDTTVKTAVFRVDGGAGRYTMRDVTNKLIQAKTKTSFGDYILQGKQVDGVSTYELTLKEKTIRWQGGKFKNSVLVSLNPNPIWDLDVKLGAAAVELDLSQYKTRQVNLDAGAASIDMKLGALVEETFVTIDAGASSIAIEVPESSGCKVRSDAELSSKDFHGFSKVKQNLYQTGNYDSATRHIIIEIDAGISSIEIRRYKDDLRFDDTTAVEPDSVMF